MYEIDTLIIVILTVILSSLIAFMTLGLFMQGTHVSVLSLASAIVQTCLHNMSSTVVTVYIPGSLVCNNGKLCTNDFTLIYYISRLSNVTFVKVGDYYCIESVNKLALLVTCNFTKLRHVTATLIVESLNSNPWTRICVLRLSVIG